MPSAQPIGEAGTRISIIDGVEAITRIVDASDVDRAAEVLADAFADYPWTRWTVDAADHRRRIIALQRIALEHFALPFGAVAVSFVDGAMCSVAAWSVSAAVASFSSDAEHQAQVATLEGTRHVASKAADRQIEPHRPQHHHLYLGTVGTVPAMQGRGLATQTLRPLINAADAEGNEFCVLSGRAR